ncbi:hypothetical protein FRB99_000582 [Tulasnella sp. 403]|nr:hypothetical protein FRB99_000582 [Tulasnella sp. 403]
MDPTYLPVGTDTDSAQPTVPVRNTDHESDLIDRLPAELLICIFLDVLARLDSHDRFNIPFTLAQVSRRWRQLCLTSPCLWTYTGNRKDNYIFEVLNAKRIAMQLARSASLPLDVELGSYLWRGEMFKRHLEGLCPLIVPMAPRLKSIKLMGRIPSLRTIILRYLGDLRELPLLEDLRIPVIEREDLTPLPQHISCPRIRRLHLYANVYRQTQALPLPVFSSYPTLTALVLDKFAASMEKVRLLLQVRPQIETLELHRTHIDVEVAVLSPPIAAPCLRRLCIKVRREKEDQAALVRSKWRWITTLMRALEAPELTELKYGFVSRNLAIQAARIVHGDQKLGELFPKLDTVGVWNMWLGDEDLESALLLNFADVRRIEFTTVETLKAEHFVPELVHTVASLVEKGALGRLEVLDMRGISPELLYLGLKERKKRIPLRVVINESDITKRRPIEKVGEIVDLELYRRD